MVDMKRTQGGTGGRIGKDELNLADWRISVTTHQQPQTKDGGKIDFVEYVLPSASGPDQKVTLEAPSRKGLPTPADEDVLIALLALAKEENFADDIMHFVPGHLIQIMGWQRNQKSMDRLEMALKRLTALTITYELTWYNKMTAEVEPILVTGILAESKLVRRRGRHAKDQVPDSYIQWTNDFYQSIRSGNLTNLDLDLYFSLKRPGAKQLYRHLNKRWFNGRKPNRYERDLTHIATGHLGLKPGKDMKRNFHNLIKELEACCYLTTMSEMDRYRKIRPGIYRVCFELHPDRMTRRKAATQTVEPGGAGEQIIQSYYKHRFNEDGHRCKVREISFVESLLAEYPAEIVSQSVLSVADTMKRKFADGATIMAADPYFREECGFRLKQQQRRADAAVKREKQRQEFQATEVEREARIKQLAHLTIQFDKLRKPRQKSIQKAAAQNAPSKFERDRILRWRPGQQTPLAILEEFDRQS